jgi:hypothetical protein
MIQEILFFITARVPENTHTVHTIKTVFSPIQIFQAGNKVEDLLSVIVN